MEEKKQYSALTIDRAAFLLLRVKKAFKKKKLQRKERERSNTLAAGRIDQRASCAGLEGQRKKPPPLLRSRTLPAIVVPGVNILQAQLGNAQEPEPILPQMERMGSGRRSFLSARVSFSRDDSATLDTRRKSAISRLCGSGSYGPERGSDGTLLLRVPAPHVVAASAYRISGPSSGSSTALCRLGKLLNNQGTSGSSSSKSQMTVDDGNVIRRLSWERRDPINSRLPRSASIDSMVEAVWAESVEAASEPLVTSTTNNAKRPSLMRSADRPLALVSPSVGRRLKGQRGINELGALAGECEMEVASLPTSTNLPPVGHKPSKKEAKLMQQRLERLAKVNIHLHALFAAVEHGYLEKARTILESTDVDVNSVNGDGLSPLDVAVLSNNRPLVKMLIGFGAREGQRFSNPDSLGSNLKLLLAEAEMRLQELGGVPDEPTVPPNTRASFSAIIGSAYPASAMTGCAGGDTDKQTLAWSRKSKTLRRLVLGFAQARPPDPPSLAAIDIVSQTSIALRLHEPTPDSAITTKYRVQWSTRADFAHVSGEREVNDTGGRVSVVVELTSGRRYYFRAACGNLKGWGAFLSSAPASVVPSSWREVDGRRGRYEGRLKQLEALQEDIRQLRPGSEMLEGPSLNQRRNQRKKTTIKQLFTAASKFQKHLRRGIYLACILYHEDKVLVTNEDFLPVIEIDESFPSCIHNDLHWLMKVSCTWDDTKSLRADMEKNASSTIHFRSKLLTAVLQMQSSLGLQDLGQLYYKPLKDAHGTVVLSTVNYVKAPKSVSVLNSRWLPMNKVFKKMVLGDDHSVNEVLMGSIQEQINYHQVSGLKLGRGLYLAYLKMQSSVDLIQVVVSAKSPNMLPHCKVRDNPHVSAEEWEHLKQQHLPDLLDNASEQQRTFLDLITSAAKRLFNYMEIKPADLPHHRLYNLEIVDLTADVSFLIVCPPADHSCSVPGQREILLQRADLLPLPLQVFEMIHLATYQPPIIRKFAKLSCLLELDAATASQSHREAFSNAELAIAKERLHRLTDLQARLNETWREARWLMEAIAFARDKNMAGVAMRYVLDKECTTPTSPKRSLLQIPARDAKAVKATPGRGSWPGPGTLNATPSLISGEFSKSEQHLSTNESASQYLSACSDESRKNSDSYTSDYFLPPSRSEDMLFAIPDGAAVLRTRARTVSATTSPLLSVRNYGGSLISVNTTNTSESLHSLSSDSDPQPVTTSTPRKKHQINCTATPKMAPSRSMTNVKGEVSRPRPKHLNLEQQSALLSKSLTNIANKARMADGAQAGILQVFAAYETGLASGTSLKLHVTPRTTAREVVDLVVKQLNMAVVLKGKEGPIYPADKLKNFCLVAVIGARERCLRDDFKPLQLQNPWKKGRLYVRQKHDVLAALEHSSRHSAII